MLLRLATIADRVEAGEVLKQSRILGAKTALATPPPHGAEETPGAHLVLQRLPSITGSAVEGSETRERCAGVYALGLASMTGHLLELWSRCQPHSKQIFP